MTRRKITIHPSKLAILLRVAEILETIPEDEADHFELNSYDESFTLKDQAANLREMVGYADGSIQYDQRIGPAPKPVPIDIYKYMRAVHDTLAAHIDTEFAISAAKIGARITIRKPAWFKS